MTNTIEVATKNLPHALRQLVKMTGKRPSTVELTYHTGVVELCTSYRTVGVFTLGEQLSSKDTSWMGSDGEPNSQTTLTFSGPTARVTNTFNRRQRFTVELFVGNLPGWMVERLTLATRMTELWGMLDAAVDLSISLAPSVAEAAKVEHAAVVSSALDTRDAAAPVLATFTSETVETDSHADAMEAAGWLS